MPVTEQLVSCNSVKGGDCRTAPGPGSCLNKRVVKCKHPRCARWGRPHPGKSSAGAVVACVPGSAASAQLRSGAGTAVPLLAQTVSNLQPGRWAGTLRPSGYSPFLQSWVLKPPTSDLMDAPAPVQLLAFPTSSSLLGPHQAASPLASCLK